MFLGCIACKGTISGEHGVDGFVGERGGWQRESARERGGQAQTVVVGEGGGVQSARGGVGVRCPYRGTTIIRTPPPRITVGPSAYSYSRVLRGGCSLLAWYLCTPGVAGVLSRTGSHTRRNAKGCFE